MRRVRFSLSLRLPFLAAALALAAAAPARAQASPGAVDLLVTDGETGVPLAGAQVRLDGEPRGVSDSAGRVRLDPVVPGTHALSVEMIGRIAQQPRVDVPAGRVLDLEVVLDPSTIPIPPVVVTTGTATRSARTRARGSGIYLGRDDILRSRARRVSEMVGKVPGVRVLSGADGMVAMLPALLGGPTLGTANRGLSRCVARVILDGVVLPTPNLDAVSLGELDSIEVYVHVVPGEYNGAASGCGVIVLNTRAQ